MKSDKDLETTLMIICIKDNDLSNLVTLSTLNVLKILTPLKAESDDCPPEV